MKALECQSCVVSKPHVLNMLGAQGQHRAGRRRAGECQSSALLFALHIPCVPCVAKLLMCTSHDCRKDSFKSFCISRTLMLWSPHVRLSSTFFHVTGLRLALSRNLRCVYICFVTIVAFHFT